MITSVQEWSIRDMGTQGHGYFYTQMYYQLNGMSCFMHLRTPKFSVWRCLGQHLYRTIRNDQKHMKWHTFVVVARHERSLQDKPMHRTDVKMTRF